MQHVFPGFPVTLQARFFTEHRNSGVCRDGIYFAHRVVINIYLNKKE